MAATVYAQFASPVGFDPVPRCPVCQVPVVASRNFQTHDFEKRIRTRHYNCPRCGRRLDKTYRQ